VSTGPWQASAGTVCLRAWHTAYLWRPRFLINVINANDQISRVKPADPGQTKVNLGHHPENLAIEPYWTPWPSLHTSVVNPWSKARSNPLNRWRRRMSSGTFAVFSKFHLNTSKSTFMKVVHLVEGHNFRGEWHFKFWAD
jgi:hypothetical protein